VGTFAVHIAKAVKTQNPADLQVLKELVEAGKITPVIDGTYPLTGTPQAIGRVGQGHARGTVVITLPGPYIGAFASANTMTTAAGTA